MSKTRRVMTLLWPVLHPAIILLWLLAIFASFIPRFLEWFLNPQGI